MFYIIALIFFAVLVLFLSFYVYKKQQGTDDIVSRIGIYIMAIGVVVSVIIGLSNATLNNEQDADAIVGTTVMSNYVEDKVKEYTYSNITKKETVNTINNTTDNVNSDVSFQVESSNFKTTKNDNTNAPKTSSPVPNTLLNNNKSFRELKTYSYDGSITFEEIASDPRGKTFNNAYVFYGEYYSLNTGGGEYDTPYIEKYLGGEFNNFSAIINPHKTFDKYNKDIKAIIDVYADGNKIVSREIIKATQNESINVNVSGVDYLRIELNPGTDMQNYFNQYTIILSDAKVNV